MHANVQRYLFGFGILYLAVALILSGCAGSPTSPDIVQGPELTAARDVAGQAHQCLGYYFATVDKDTQAVEVIEIRSGQWHFNLTGILNQTMGVSAKMVPGQSDPSHGLFVLDITLKHPFAAKPQFSGFDVKGILMTPGTLHVGSLVFADADETRLLNADGYTRWWNPTEFTQPGILGYTKGNLALSPAGVLTATINPFKGFADLLEAETEFGTIAAEPIDTDLGRGVFLSGSENTRRYEIRFPMDPGPKVKFGYAVDAAWNTPDPNPPVEVPDDFPINANQPEPFHVALSVALNTLYFDTEAAGGGVGGGLLALDIEVSDWQGIASGDIHSEITSVFIFSPDLFDTGVEAAFVDQDSTRARYRVDLSDVAVPSHAGETLLVCKVASADGSTYQQAPAPAPSAYLASYQVLVLDIPNPDCEVDGNNSFEEAIGVELGEAVADQVCLPDDESDYYVFEIPLGVDLTGSFVLTCDAEPTTLSLYDQDELLIAQDSVSGKIAEIQLDGLDLNPGSYYIEITTANNTQVAPYYLELSASMINIAPTDPVEITPSTLVVKPDRIWQHGSYAFLLGELGCWVYNLSNPVAPSQIAYEHFRASDKAAFSYPYLYFALALGDSEAQVNLVDLTDPAAPMLVEDVLHYSHPVSNLCMNSSELYVGVRTSPSMSEVDIYNYSADPQAPSPLGAKPVSHLIVRMALLEKEGVDTHLAISGISTLYTYNVENPSSVTGAGMYVLPDGYLRDMISMGGTMGDYLVGTIESAFAGDGWLYVFRQTEVPDIEVVGSVDLPGSGVSVEVQGSYAYVGDGPEGFSVCGLSTPSSPTYETSIPTIAQARDVSVQGAVACVIPFDAGMQVIDVSTPTVPTHLARLHVVNCPQAAAVSGNYIFAGVGPGTGGIEEQSTYYAVQSVDISIPEFASVEDELDLLYPPVQFFLDGTRLAVAEEERWTLLNVGNPLDLSEISSVEPGAYLSSVGLYQNALYVGTADQRMIVYNITNPSAPVESTQVAIGDIPRDFTFHSGYMYLSITSGLEIFSLGDPQDPQSIGTLPFDKPARESVVYAGKLYIVTKTRIVVAALTDPSAPDVLGALEIDPVADLTQIAMEGLYGYVQGPGGVPHACSVWPPDLPAYVGQIYDHEPYGEARDLAVWDGTLYEASNDSGLRIYDLY